MIVPALGLAALWIGFLLMVYCERNNQPFKNYSVLQVLVGVIAMTTLVILAAVLP